MLNLVKTFNFILACDSYKTNHYLELPDFAKRSYVVCVPRKRSRFSDKIVAIGHSFISFILSRVRITEEMIDEAELEIHQQGYEFNREGWEIIARELDGKIPLKVWGVEEGRVVDPQTPILGIMNTDDRFAWLPAYVETWTQGTIWMMSTVASICRQARITVSKYMEMTGADMTGLDYKVHNFGDRGAAGANEAAVLAGIAHAALFSGSDCTRANGYIKKIYNTSKAYTSSIEATEHSVTCANSDAGERDDFGGAQMAVNRLYSVVERTKRGIGIPLLSVVIDTYDSRRFVRDYMGTQFKEAILNSGGKMIFRPDSGDPTVEPSLVAKDVEDTFGASVNAAGYKVLHPQTGVIQGDGINIETMESVIQGWVNAGYSMDSLALGMGHGTTNYGARDDFSFSMKGVALFDGSRWIRLLKEPITDMGKKSLTGLVRCREVNGELQVFDALKNGDEYNFANESVGWQLYYEDGYQKYRTTFDEVRVRAQAGI